MKLSICLVTTVSMMLLTQLSTITESHVKRSKCRIDYLLKNHGKYKSKHVLERPYLGRFTRFDPDDDRIIGGEETTIKDNPFMLSLLYRPAIDEEEVYFKCGAAIIHKQWAVTAAHCLADVRQKLVKEGLVFLRGNTSYWKSPEAIRNDHFIEYYQKHEGYIGSKTDDDYDICIMKVKEEFDGLREIPIAVAHNSYKYVEGTSATVLGWGITGPHEDNSSPVLREVALSLTDFKNCQKVHRRINKTVTKRMVCAWKNNADSCSGDSGGPLIQKQALIGIVSWGVECASTDWPGVYTRLSEYSDWISKRIHHSRSC